MRILLDECVNHLPDYEFQSAKYAGLGGLKNGELLAAAEAARTLSQECGDMLDSRASGSLRFPTQ